MLSRNIWRLVSTGALVLMLLGLLAPSPAATRGQTPLEPAAIDGPALCQFPAPGAGEVSVLNAVADVPFYSERPAHNAMWAVGYTTKQAIGTPDVGTLTLYFNGRTWQVVPSPNLAAENVLTGVAAYGENDVWAVGYTYDGFEYGPLLLHFDGAVWAPQPVPIPHPDWIGPWDVRLTGVRILSSYSEGGNGPQPDTEAVIVGYGEHFGASQPFVLHYDGSAWQLMPLPPTMTTGRLYAVAGDSLDDLWAVGTLDVEGQQIAHLFHRTANGWTPIVKGLGVLTSLTVAGDQVFTSGHVRTFDNLETLVMAYTISTGDWVQIQSFNQPAGDNVLTAITASTDTVYAVGYVTNPVDDVSRETLVLAYNGVTFVPVGSPNPDRTNELHGAVVSRNVLWTVGTTGHGQQRSTLVLNNTCISDH